MKELEDRSWFPDILRNFQTEFIGFVVARFGVYDAFIRYLNDQSLPSKPMADLCSGSGEPAISIFRKSNCFDRLTLTDKYPSSLPFRDEKISYDAESKDVLEMEFSSGICYTMFNSFHHFKDEDKVKIARGIQASGSRGFIVEILEPTIACFLKVLLITTFGNLLLTPFVRPFSLTRLLFTYVVPVNLFTIPFDGIVSVLKSRSVSQYRKLFAGYASTIQVMRLQNGLAPLILIQTKPTP